MKEKYFIKKLDQDDIMEIVTEYFLEKEYSGCVSTKACLLGVPGQDLRLIAVFSKGDKRIQCDFEDIDKTVDYNGSHAFLRNNPEFCIKDENICKCDWMDNHE